MNARQVRRLQAWSRHILFGTWTHGGYLNWIPASDGPAATSSSTGRSRWTRWSSR